jgi:hypothetical protein
MEFVIVGQMLGLACDVGINWGREGVRGWGRGERRMVGEVGRVWGIGVKSRGTGVVVGEGVVVGVVVGMIVEWLNGAR